jgi:hypothetical protein
MASRALNIDPKANERGASEPLNESAQRAVSDSADDREIAVLAYQLWHERGCPIGSDQEDWFRAEREIARSKRPTDEEVGNQDSAERLIDAKEADSPMLRFPVRSEVFQGFHERPSRKGLKGYPDAGTEIVKTA